MFTTLQTEFQKSIQPAARTAETSRPQSGWSSLGAGDAQFTGFGMGGNQFGYAAPFLQQLGYDTTRRTTMAAGSDYNSSNRFSQDQLDANASANDAAMAAFKQKYGDGARIIQRPVGERQVEFAVMDGNGQIRDNYTHTYDKDSWMDKVVPALAIGTIGAVGAGALGFGPLAPGALGEGAALSGMDLAADAALGSGNNIFTAGQALSGAGGIAGTGIPAYAQAPGYGTNVATLADASGASPFTAGGADPMTAYLTTGASEGSTIGNALTGAGGAAGAVGSGTTAGTLGTIGNFLGGATSALGGSGGLLNLGGNLLNSYLGYKASNKAADAQINASREANALAKYMYDQTRTDNMPALNARNAGLTGYQNLLQNPSSITSDPGYQFGFQQGQAAYDNSGSARGMRLSGAQAKALTKFGQDYGQTKFNESLNRYGNLAGLGQTGSGTIANAGMNYANTAGNNITGAGNAAASGYIGGANAITGGISNFLKGWQENSLLKQLGLGG